MSDLISRKAAIDALRGYLVGKRCPDDGTLTCRLIENEVINKLPPIQPDNNSEVPNSSDCISRQQAIDALYSVDEYNSRSVKAIKQLSPILPGKDKVSDLLYHIYSIQSPHLDVTGVVAKKYYCEELWKELFGKESELPGWMT